MRVRDKAEPVVTGTCQKACKVTNMPGVLVFYIHSEMTLLQQTVARRMPATTSILAYYIYLFIELV